MDTSQCGRDAGFFSTYFPQSRNNKSQEQKETLISRIRLTLIKLDDLLNTVRPSGLIHSDKILDAIKEQNERRSGRRGMDLPYRGRRCKCCHKTMRIRNPFTTKQHLCFHEARAHLSISVVIFDGQESTQVSRSLSRVLISKISLLQPSA